VSEAGAARDLACADVAKHVAKGVESVVGVVVFVEDVADVADEVLTFRKLLRRRGQTE
jgi:hypothetical protein